MDLFEWKMEDKNRLIVVQLVQSSSIIDQSGSIIDQDGSRGLRG